MTRAYATSSFWAAMDAGVAEVAAWISCIRVVKTCGVLSSIARTSCLRKFLFIRWELT